MTVERRFLTGYELKSTDEAGLVLGEDGAIEVVAPGGARSPLGGAAAAAGLPTLVMLDATGGDKFGGNRGDPTPVTTYTVVRDDLDAAANPADYPRLPAGYYLGGGYIDFVYAIGIPNPAGVVQAYVEAHNAETGYPESDLGAPGVGVGLRDHGNYIAAPTILFSVTADDTPFGMLLDYRLSSGDHFTWVRWVFWAVQVVAL